jgi:hypothetical protein
LTSSGGECAAVVALTFCCSRFWLACIALLRLTSASAQEFRNFNGNS